MLFKMKPILVAIFLGLPRTRDYVAEKSRVKSNATDKKKKRKKKQPIKLLIMIFYYTPWSMPWNTHLKMREICLHQIFFLGAQRILWKRRQKECRTQRGKRRPGEHDHLKQLSKANMNSQTEAACTVLHWVLCLYTIVLVPSV